jgi:hypothetical protein
MPKGVFTRTNQRGEAHYAARLSDSLVREMRGSDESNNALARKFGVNSGTVHWARTGKTWKHVPMK